jgi:hypothetical protein
MDFDKTNKIWTDFTSKYNLELKDTEQHLIFVPNKRQTYSTIEILNNFKIYYRYRFYKFDVIDAANDFRIAIPVETESDFIISRPNILIRTFKNKKITYQTDTIELDNNIENEIIQTFNNFNDLKIKLTEIQVNSDFQIENNTSILELTTKQLPQDLEQIEKLRGLSIKILNELITKKIIEGQQIIIKNSAQVQFKT